MADTNIEGESCRQCDRLESDLEEMTQRLRNALVQLKQADFQLADARLDLAERSSKLSWRPIQDAPKDGTAVLGFMPAYYQGKGGQHVIVWMNFSDRPGWYSHISGMHEPTHWMPLPESPK